MRVLGLDVREAEGRRLRLPEEEARPAEARRWYLLRGLRRKSVRARRCWSAEAFRWLRWRGDGDDLVGS